MRTAATQGVGRLYASWSACPLLLSLSSFCLVNRQLYRVRAWASQYPASSDGRAGPGLGIGLLPSEEVLSSYLDSIRGLLSRFPVPYACDAGSNHHAGVTINIEVLEASFGWQRSWPGSGRRTDRWSPEHADMTRPTRDLET